MARSAFLLLVLVGCQAAEPVSSSDGGGLTDGAAPDAFAPADAWDPRDAADDARLSDAWMPACALVPASGCTGACRVGTDGELYCGEVSSNPGEYQPCSSASQCASGMQCLSTGDAPHCRAFCRVSMGAGDCTSGRTCISIQVAVEGFVVALPADVGICGAT